MKITVPISVGEFYDRLSILNIKIQNLDDQDQINNVVKEYNYLIKKGKSILKKAEHAQLFEQFLEINNQIWVLEEKIRELGKELIVNPFGNLTEKEIETEDFKNVKVEWIFPLEFSKIAYRIYVLNDERAQIKKEINLKFKSEIVEEKSYK